MKDASISPRPVQDPLPLWIGGSSRAAIRRTAKWGTGWQAGGEAPEEVAPVVAAIREAAEAEGRPVRPGAFRHRAECALRLLGRAAGGEGGPTPR